MVQAVEREQDFTLGALHSNVMAAPPMHGTSNVVLSRLQQMATDPVRAAQGMSESTAVLVGSR